MNNKIIKAATVALFVTSISTASIYGYIQGNKSDSLSRQLEEYKTEQTKLLEINKASQEEIEKLNDDLKTTKEETIEVAAKKEKEEKKDNVTTIFASDKGFDDHISFNNIVREYCELNGNKKHHFTADCDEHHEVINCIKCGGEYGPADTSDYVYAVKCKSCNFTHKRYIIDWSKR